MRDFVRNILPRVRARSPQPLNLHAELGLEQEIENENATVVSGDGVETKVGMNGVNDELGAEKNYSKGQDEKVRASKEYPSWGRSRGWPLVASLPSPQDEIEDHHMNSINSVNTNQHHFSKVLPQPHAHASHPAPGIRRVRSAVSIIPTPTHRKSSTFASRRAGPGPIRLPAGMSKVSTPPPSPSLRRSTMSHPDIASLIENWSHSGPANETLVYRTHPNSS
jgi:hypothetical protein